MAPLGLRCEIRRQSHHMKFALVILRAVLASAVLAFSEDDRGADVVPRPNIVIFFTDDQSYADLGVAGFDPDARPPNRDRLVRDRVRFTLGCATAPQCGPSRAGLISCRHQNIFGTEENRSGPLPLLETERL